MALLRYCGPILYIALWVLVGLLMVELNIYSTGMPIIQPPVTPHQTLQVVITLFFMLPIRIMLLGLMRVHFRQVLVQVVLVLVQVALVLAALVLAALVRAQVVPHKEVMTYG